MTQDEIIEMAREAGFWASGDVIKAIERFAKLVSAKAIAELESQEPVAYLCENAVGHKYFRWKKPTSLYKPIALYTHPPQRTWVGLTGEMLLKAAQSSLSPEQYDHFEAMSKHQPDIYDRLAYAIRVQDE